VSTVVLLNSIEWAGGRPGYVEEEISILLQDILVGSTKDFNMDEDIIAKNLLMGHTCFHCKHHDTKYDNDWNSLAFGRMECLWTKPPKPTTADSTCIDFELGSLMDAVERAVNMIWKNAHRA
jgi:hypothetical protein